ncbi:MAG TPA: STAS domain-containing protein [Pyrinomonadaceae bacterium]|nr:STAS domain-containing protein [Pyrinomonadaceae bacterium]
MLNITERQNGNNTILDLEGNIILGGGSKKLGQEVSRLIGENKADIVLNLSGVKYIDSSGVGELLSLSQAASTAGGSLKLSNIPQKVEEVLTLSSVLPIFEIYEESGEN